MKRSFLYIEIREAGHEYVLSIKNKIQARKNYEEKFNFVDCASEYIDCIFEFDVVYILIRQEAYIL